MSHYRCVEDSERVGYTFISWYAIGEHNTNELIFIVLLLFCIYFWFHDFFFFFLNLTLRRLQMCSEVITCFICKTTENSINFVRKEK